jgi:septum formation protein
VALRGNLGRPEVLPLVLASASPQRRAILEQLRIPFDIVAPEFEELDGTSPLERAAGKARSVDGGERPVLGVDTEVLFGGELLGKPADATAAEAMLEALSGRTHEVVSGLCLRTAAWEELHTESTLVTFRTLTPRDLAHYLAAREWEGRAGGYAIQGLGASLVERLDGDFLNVVGLPGSLLVSLLATRFPGTYGFG